VPPELYGAIADKYRALIADGTYAPGAKFPSERDLMAAEGVTSNLVVRRALQVLKDEGLIFSDHTGTWVREYRPVLSDRVGRLGGSTWPAGRAIWDQDAAGRTREESVEAGLGQAPDDIALRLDLDDDAAVVIRQRRYVLDGRPVTLATSWLPASIAAGTAIAERDTGPGGSYARLADLGHAPVRFREDVQARMPLAGEAELLELLPGTPVVVVTRTAWDAAGHPVDVTRMTSDASRYVFRYDFARAD
jgi:GntR family transcriptional regulator